MRILVLTPFFPPDVSVPAQYTKKLVSTLSLEHDVTAIHYGQLPEVAGHARLVSIKKDISTLRRLIIYCWQLWKNRQHDAVIILNGPSVELPFLLMRPWLNTNALYVLNDTEAATRNKPMLVWLKNRVTKNTRSNITPKPELLQQPFKHPLNPSSLEAVEHCQSEFATHVKEIILLCQN